MRGGSRRRSSVAGVTVVVMERSLNPKLMSSYFFPCRDLTVFLFFFFNDTATTEIYTLSLHDALPICRICCKRCGCSKASISRRWGIMSPTDRKSTRLNSSHSQISYAVFCLKKKNSNELAGLKAIPGSDVLFLCPRAARDEGGITSPQLCSRSHGSRYGTIAQS